MLPLLRTRLALALVCLVGIALELTLMRGLALRFWSHFACMVISVGLLGFGAAGTLLTLFRAPVLRHQRACLAALALALAAAIPLTWWGSQRVPLNVNFLAWSLTQVPNVLAIELLMLLPFLLAGAFVGIVLMDLPERINGHYAADLLGSGIGAIASVLAMHFLSTVQLSVALTILAFLAGLLLLSWRKPSALVLALVILTFTFFITAHMPWDPAISQYKWLALAKNFAGTKVIYQTEGPLGRIDVLEGPALHYAPGLSLQYTELPPPHIELIVDGDGVSPIYNCPKLEDWRFLDFRTAAAPFHLQAPQSPAPKVCIIGAGGGAEIGLALFHHSPSITALEMNPQIIHAMTGPLAPRGGAIYSAPGVQIINQEARGFFAATRDTFDIIQLPPVDGFGASGSGLYATQESYLYTVESIRAMFHRLSPGGVLSITRWVRTPPREELRAFDMAAQALRAENLDPAAHLFMLRSWVTASILLFKEPIEPAQIAALRDFCKTMSFDPCYFPGIQKSDTNFFNEVDHPYYFSGPQALLGPAPEREKFLAAYPFDVTAPTDDQPYFFHNFRWQSMAKFQEELGAGSRALLEMGYIMLLVALAQTVLLAILLILLPLSPGIKTLRHAPAKFTCLAYFLMLGLGFMLLEMGFLQKLVLYLAHPIYAAAVVIAAFLLFAGLGSQLSKSWRLAQNKVVSAAVAAILLLSLAYLFAMDPFLALTQSWPVPARCAIAALTIAPLAFFMGHLFPMGLQRVAQSHPILVPWSWAINGFASVTAAAAAPLLAMRFGFSRLTLVALACYLLAAILFPRIPAASAAPPRAA